MQSYFYFTSLLCTCFKVFLETTQSVDFNHFYRKKCNERKIQNLRKNQVNITTRQGSQAERNLRNIYIAESTFPSAM